MDWQHLAELFNYRTGIIIDKKKMLHETAVFPSLPLW